MQIDVISACCVVPSTKHVTFTTLAPGINQPVSFEFTWSHNSGSERRNPRGEQIRGFACLYGFFLNQSDGNIRVFKGLLTTWKRSLREKSFLSIGSFWLRVHVFLSETIFFFCAGSFGDGECEWFFGGCVYEWFFLGWAYFLLCVWQVAYCTVC